MNNYVIRQGRGINRRNESHDSKIFLAVPFDTSRICIVISQAYQILFLKVGFNQKTLIQSSILLHNFLSVWQL